MSIQEKFRKYLFIRNRILILSMTGYNKLSETTLNDLIEALKDSNLFKSGSGIFGGGSSVGGSSFAGGSSSVAGSSPIYGPSNISFAGILNTESADEAYSALAAEVKKRIDEEQNYSKAFKQSQENLEEINKTLKERLDNDPELDLDSAKNDEEKASIQAKIDAIQQELKLATVGMSITKEQHELQQRQNKHLIVGAKATEAKVKAENEYAKWLEEKYKDEQLIADQEKNAKIKLISKQANINSEHIELKGYNKNGKKNSGYELFRLIADWKREWDQDSAGRKAGKIAKGAVNLADRSLKSISTGKMDVGAMADKLSGTLSKAGPWGAAAGGVVQILKTLFEMYSKVDSAASNYARTVGGGKLAMEKMKQTMGDVADKATELKGVAYDAAELIKSMSEYSTKLGRNLEHLSTYDLTAIQDLSNFGIDGDILSNFDTFGISIQETSERLHDLYAEAGKKGLNAKAVQDTMTKNLKLAQNYTFKNGVKALERMAERSTALKFNIQEATKFAEKVNTVEGAVNTAAQLSVLGGSYARNANPLQMLYGALNNPEQLMEQQIRMFSNKAKWDDKTKQFKISAYDNQMIKAAADAIGADAGEMRSLAMNKAREDRVTAQITGGVDKETEEYIKNVAKIDKNGKAVVTFKQGTNEERTVDVASLSSKDKAALAAESKKKGEIDGADMGSILSSTMSIQDRLDKIIQLIKNKIVAWLMKIAEVNNDEIAMQGMSEHQKMAFKDKIAGRGDLSLDEMITIAEETKKAVPKETENTPSQKANGGFISGKGTATSDSIPARLSNGEFVVNAAATAKNRNTLEAINSQKFANGGIVTNNVNENNNKHEKSISTAAYNNNNITNISNSNISNYKRFANGGIVTNNVNEGGQYKNSNSSILNSTNVNKYSNGGFVSNIISSAKNLKNNISTSVASPSNSTNISLYSALEKVAKEQNSIETLTTNKIFNSGFMPNIPLLSTAKNILEIKRPKKIDQNYSIKPVENYSNSLPVLKSSSYTEPNNNNINRNLSFEPLNINISGKVDIGGQNVKASDLINSQIIDKIIREIQIRTDYGLDKTKTHIKYLS